ncbi:MAG: Trk system potassium transporter TrkA [Ruminococcaceae bacterium]|nr:Trk system potassium transporter TrkA [Oscillospiraceae bacterium]
MKIVVSGCGKIGFEIIKNLVNEGHDVIAVDNNPAAIEEITNVCDVMGVTGNSADCETLAEAGIADTQLFVAVTGSDEMNMLSCYIAKRMGAEHTIARIRNPEYNDNSLSFMRQQLGLSLSINPELLTAKEIFNVLKFPSAVKVENFSKRGIELVEIKLSVDSELDGLTMVKMREKYKADYLVCAVTRGEEAFIPAGNFVLKAGDKIGIIAAPNELQKLLKMLGVLRKQAKSVMILGASKTAYYLSKMLISAGIDVKIIEQNAARCEEFGAELGEKAVIINGDGAEQELLLEEGIRAVDSFVALTGMDEENIIVSLFATTQGVQKVITKINREEMCTLANKLGLDSIIVPKSVNADILVRYARALENSMGSNVETLYKILDGRAEALEFNVRSDFTQVDIPLKNMKFKQNILIAGIVRGRKTIIPSGDDVIKLDDKVIVVAANQRLNDLADIIK